MRLSVVIDCADPDLLAGFWEAALGYTRTEELGVYRVLVPPPGDGGPVLVLQQVPEPREGKNRLHLDLHPDDPEACLARLVGLGAGPYGERVVEFGLWWQRLTDPEGNLFCVIAGAQPPP
jgi:hypothetical protein